MSTTIDRAAELVRRDVPAKSPRATLLRVLLACGVLYPLVYAVANAVVAATRYEGYSRTSQAVSELSASGAPTRPFLTVMLPIFSVLMIAFGIGVWRSAHGKRALRVTGGLLVADGIIAFAGGAWQVLLVILGSRPPRPPGGRGYFVRAKSATASTAIHSSQAPMLMRSASPNQGVGSPASILGDCMAVKAPDTRTVAAVRIE